MLVTFGYYRWFIPEKKPSAEKKSIKREPMHKKLGFTEEQSQKMKELRKTLFKEIRPLINQLHERRKEMIEIIKQDAVTIEQINEKIDQISEIETIINKKATANLLKYKEILTKEQRDKFLEMVAGRIFGSDHGRRKHSRSNQRESTSDKQSPIKRSQDNKK